jgi:predicted aspartyl protease
MVEARRFEVAPAEAGRAAEIVRRAYWRAPPRRALLSAVPPHAQALLCGCLLGTLLPRALADDATQIGQINQLLQRQQIERQAEQTTAAAREATPPSPNSAPAPATVNTAATASSSLNPGPAPAATGAPTADQLSEVIVQSNEPKFVAPTRRDRIGRIWAPVLIDGKGPYRLVLDTGANRSAVTVRTAQSLGIAPTADGSTLVTGFTGSAVVPTIHVTTLEVGDLLMGPQDLPVLADVFGGAQGVLGIEGLTNKRIYADFTRDRLEISRSHGERARYGFTVVPLKLINGGLLSAEVRVGGVRARAIVDTGAQGTVGNLALRTALMRHPPSNAMHEDIIGVTLDVQGGDNIPAPEIDFGHMTVKGVRITFGDMYLFQHWKLTDEPTLTLGMDLLGSFDVLIIDYNRRELQIRLRS